MPVYHLSFILSDPHLLNKMMDRYHRELLGEPADRSLRRLSRSFALPKIAPKTIINLNVILAEENVH